VVGDYIFMPKAYNEFSPGNTGSGSYGVRAAAEIPLFGLPWMLEGDYRSWQYPHNTTFNFGSLPPGSPGCPIAGEQGCVSLPGGLGQTFIPGFLNQEQDLDIRIGFRVLNPRIYIGVGYLWNLNNTLPQVVKANPGLAGGCCGYPTVSGVGFGLEKLPDLDHVVSIFGSAWYYPNISGTYQNGFFPFAGPSGVVQPATFPLSYREVKYQAGVSFSFTGTPFFLELGYLGDQGFAKANAPVNYSHGGGFVGLGLHF
jgi:hypothetical protein